MLCKSSLQWKPIRNVPFCRNTICWLKWKQTERAWFFGFWFRWRREGQRYGKAWLQRNMIWIAYSRCNEMFKPQIVLRWNLWFVLEYERYQNVNTSCICFNNERKVWHTQKKNSKKCSIKSYILDNKGPIFIFEFMCSRVFEQCDWYCVVVWHSPWNMAFEWIYHVWFPW